MVMGCTACVPRVQRQIAPWGCEGAGLYLLMCLGLRMVSGDALVRAVAWFGGHHPGAKRVSCMARCACPIATDDEQTSWQRSIKQFPGTVNVASSNFQKSSSAPALLCCVVMSVYLSRAEHSTLCCSTPPWTAAACLPLQKVQKLEKSTSVVSGSGGSSTFPAFV